MRLLRVRQLVDEHTARREVEGGERGEVEQGGERGEGGRGGIPAGRHPHQIL